MPGIVVREGRRLIDERSTDVSPYKLAETWNQIAWVYWHQGDRTRAVTQRLQPRQEVLPALVGLQQPPPNDLVVGISTDEQHGKIGRELGVRYVLEGSVRKDGDQDTLERLLDGPIDPATDQRPLAGGEFVVGDRGVAGPRQAADARGGRMGDRRARCGRRPPSGELGRG